MLNSRSRTDFRLIECENPIVSRTSDSHKRNSGYNSILFLLNWVRFLHMDNISTVLVIYMLFGYKENKMFLN